jgi:hypothetical protein
MDFPFKIPDLNPAQWNLVTGILVGLSLLLFGRRLYWLMFATVWFLVAMLVTTVFLPPTQESQWWLVVPFIAGIAGAILSLFVHKTALRFFGALAGAYVGYHLLQPHVVDPWPWVGLGVGVLVGFLMVMMVFNGALILLSSLLGAMLLLEPMSASPEVRMAVTAGLVIVGCAIQTRSRPKDKKEKD